MTGIFYLKMEVKRIKVRPIFRRATDHEIIPFGKGICGQVAVSNEFIVPDVSVKIIILPAVSLLNQIVIPIFLDNKNIGQIDIDSDTINAFNTKTKF